MQVKVAEEYVIYVNDECEEHLQKVQARIMVVINRGHSYLGIIYINDGAFSSQRLNLSGSNTCVMFLRQNACLAPNRTFRRGGILGMVKSPPFAFKILQTINHIIDIVPFTGILLNLSRSKQAILLKVMRRQCPAFLLWTRLTSLTRMHHSRSLLMEELAACYSPWLT